jgi:enoyl-CoA hydratase
VTRDQLEAETEKFALACSRTRPTDAVFMQKTFFEVMKQHQGEYMGSVLTGWLESMLPMVKNDGGLGVDGETFDRGLNNAVKDNDRHFPPEWRMSMAARGAAQQPPLEELRGLVALQQKRIEELERMLTKPITPAA